MTQVGHAEGFGQTVQIYTRLHSFVGQPTWLLMIYDEDHGQVVPYLYDFHRGENIWMAFTYSDHYSIFLSKVQISTYQAIGNRFKQVTLSNFCGLEDGIIDRQSMYVTVSGDLTLDGQGVTCRVSRFQTG